MVFFLKPDTFSGVVKGMIGGIVVGIVTFLFFLGTDTPEIFSIAITIGISLSIFLYQYLYSKYIESDSKEELPLISSLSNGD